MITAESQRIIAIAPLFFNEMWRLNSRGIEVLSQLFRQLSPYREAQLSSDDLMEIARKSDCLLAFDKQNGHIVGLARLIIRKDGNVRYGIIHDVVVDQEHRGQGIGKALVLEAIAFARRARLQHVELTSKPARVVANQLYRSLGFELIKAANPNVEGDTNHYRLVL